MEVQTLYNVPVKLEKGDLIAVKNRDLYIRPHHDKDKVYKSSVFDLENLEEEIMVSSAGSIKKHNFIYSNFKWEKYVPKTYKD